MEKLHEKLDESWNSILKSEFEKSYYQELSDFVQSAYEVNNPTVYPPKELVFSAFNHCSFDNLKVVILGQDPYHGPNQANGLCFSVADYVPLPRSLYNIFEELRRSLNQPIPLTGNLEHWAKQGVLLLNDVLTVYESQAGSHQKKGWEKFTDAVIKSISENKKDVVFMLWGNYAQKKGKIIDSKKHLILQSGHPSPLSANQGKWFGNQHFILCNDYLKSKGKKPIEWELV